MMALVDTNCNPDPIDYIIACNDDALKSIKLILEALAQAIVEKKNEIKVYASKEGSIEDDEEETGTSSGYRAEDFEEAKSVKEGI